MISRAVTWLTLKGIQNGVQALFISPLALCANLLKLFFFLVSAEIGCMTKMK